MKRLFLLTSQFGSDEVINFLISVPVHVHVRVRVHVHAHVQDMDTDMETDSDRDRDTDRDGTWTWTWTTIVDEATLSIDVEKMETMKRLFAFKLGQ
jgi:hypothetical protein